MLKRRISGRDNLKRKSTNSLLLTFGLLQVQPPPKIVVSDELQRKQISYIYTFGAVDLDYRNNFFDGLKIKLVKPVLVNLTIELALALLSFLQTFDLPPDITTNILFTC